MSSSALLLIPVLLLLNNVSCQEEDTYYEGMVTELQLADLDLIDAYDDISQASKNVLLGVQEYEEKVKAELQKGIITRQEHESSLDSQNEVPFDLQRNWTLLTKTGDFLLPENDYKLLVDFHNANEEISHRSQLPCINKQQNCTINNQEYEDVLTKSKNVYELKTLWEARQHLFDESANKFGDILELVNKAHVSNGQLSSVAYWEMLSEYEDGYTKAKALWSEILPLYKKLHKFVKTRLYKHYNITSASDLLPVYLLGNNFGNDWSNIADIILPHPYLYTEVNNELKYQTVQNIFELAAKTTRTMGLGSLAPSFFSESVFNFSSCGPHIFSHCGLSKTEVITCSRLGWNEYINIYEATLDVVLRSVDYYSYPRMQMRFSAVDEAIKGLSSLLAISDLTINEIIPQNAFSNEGDKYNRKNTALLLTALHILPKLPYYIIADTWRLEALRVKDNNFAEKWWKKRHGVQGVQGTTGFEPDFLGDPFITSNKPYLSKFLGVFLQFQILNYYQKYFASGNETIAQAMGRDENFKKFIGDRPNKSWLELISFYYNFDDVSSTALLEYFKPLEDYLDNAPIKQVVIPVTKKLRPIKTSSPQTVSKNGLNTTLVEGNGTDSNEQMTKSGHSISVASSSYEAVAVFSGIAGLIIINGIIIVVVRRLQRRQKNHINNRRFGTS